MQPLVTRPMTVSWDAPPDAVAASIQRAIDEQRYEDAGHPEWSLWLIKGTVKDRTLDIRLDTHSAPGSVHAYPAGLELRGELVPRGAGTQLVARAAMLGSGSERLWALVLVAGLGLPLLFFGGIAGVVACVLTSAAILVFYVGLLHVVSVSPFSALPQVEEVLGRVGTSSAP